MRSYHPDVKFNIVNTVHKDRVVTANLLGRVIVSVQQGIAGQTRLNSNTKVAGLGEIFVQREFCGIRYITKQQYLRPSKLSNFQS